MYVLQTEFSLVYQRFDFLQISRQSNLDFLGKPKEEVRIQKFILSEGFWSFDLNSLSSSCTLTKMLRHFFRKKEAPPHVNPF